MPAERAKKGAKTKTADRLPLKNSSETGDQPTDRKPLKIKSKCPPLAAKKGGKKQKQPQATAKKQFRNRRPINRP